MNLLHRRLCRSGYWARTVARDLLPWVLDGLTVQGHVLEIGPGPGIVTDLLRNRVAHLTCLEIDSAMAAGLAARMAASHAGNVTVQWGDAAVTPFLDGSFDAALSLTMLHHVRSPARQDDVLTETARVLRPGGLFAGSDILPSAGLRLLHLFDTMVPVDPGTFPGRLAAAGFGDIAIEVRSRDFRFRARRLPH